MEEGLRRLGRAQVDVCTLHNPTMLGAEARGLPVDAVLGPVEAGMHALRAAGLCRFVGFSGPGDTPALPARRCSGHLRHVPVLLQRDQPQRGYPGSPDGVAQDFDGLLDRGEAAGLGVFAIRILAGGAAVATPERHPTAGAGSALAQGTEYDRDVARAAALRALAAEFGLESPLELACRFALAKGGISCVLVGPSSVAHVADACAGKRVAHSRPMPSRACSPSPDPPPPDTPFHIRSGGSATLGTGADPRVAREHPVPGTMLV